MDLKVKFTYLEEINGQCRAEIDAAIADTINRSSYIGGEDIEKFESTFASYVGAEDCAACSSGSSAIHLALIAAGVTSGDIVITPSLSFIATTEAILNVGAVPLFCDIGSDGCISVRSLESILAVKSTASKVAAVLFTDMYGHAANRSAIRKLCDQHDIIMIEDAAQAFGISGLGQIADLSCVSFNPVKNLGALGDAGAVFGKKSYMDVIRKIREHGKLTKDTFDCVGFNYRMDNMQANILRAKLPYLKEWNAHRKKVVHFYNSNLEVGICNPIQNESVHHIYPIHVFRQHDFFNDMRNIYGIDVRCHYPVSIPDQPMFCRVDDQSWRSSRSFISFNGLSMASSVAASSVSLPIPFGDNWEQLAQYVADSVNKWILK